MNENKLHKIQESLLDLFIKNADAPLTIREMQH
ncbi:MAG: hypothetical protein K1060chlam1_01370, partial [Candidatus Anoxychlamydiales bacterium]|nr:hypothetical protein [Candidatus Anoxychlamydiales bacterium]